MRLELITTGSELLLGFTLNTHVNYVARQLATLGLRLTRQTTTADDPAEMRAAVAAALARCDCLLLTGGLGPTADDCTRAVVAELLGRELLRDEPTATAIAARYARRGVTMPERVNVQALAPAGARVLANRNGTAPGLQLEHEGKLIFLLPGPPRELKPMFEEYVVPELRARVGAAPPFVCRVFKVVGVPESVVEATVEPRLAAWPALELGYCARLGEVDVRCIAPTLALADEAEREIRAAFGADLIGAGDAQLEEIVVQLLTKNGQTVAVAESCTGGLIAHRLTNISGASAVFPAACVTYSNAAKTDLLGVDPATLAAHGAVSAAVACEMAAGARARHGTDFGVSATGIAGPTGGTAEKPVGLLYLGLASAAGVEAQRYQLGFDRETFKIFAAQYALDWLRRAALANPR